MPRKEDIERFAQVLSSLGDEPAIRAARSETIDETPSPEQPAGEEPGIESFEGVLGAGGPSAEPGGEPGSEAESLQDIFQSLSGLPEEAGPGTGGAPAGRPAAAAPAAGAGAGAGAAAAGEAEGLDFASLFGEEPAPEGIEDLSAPSRRPPPARGAPPRGAAPRVTPPQPAEAAAGEEAFAEPSASGAEEPFSLPEGEVESLGADLSALETLPEEPGTAEAAAGPEEAPGAGESFEDLGSFSLPGEPAPEAGEEAAGEGPFDVSAAPGEAGASESFELPSLDDLSFPEPGGGAPAEPSQAAAQEPSAFEEPGGFEAPSSFETPSAFEEPAGVEAPSPFEEPTAAVEPSMETSLEEPAEPAEGAAEPMPTFDLDTATFEEPAGGPGPAGELPSAGRPGPEPGEAGAGLEGLGDESLGDLDSFSLPESAEQFGIQGVGAEQPAAAPQPPPRPRPAERRGRPAPRAPEPPTEELRAAELPEGPAELTPEQFARLKQNLAALPRNLKIAVQDLIGEGMVSGADLAALLGLLVRGASAQEIATLAGRISGKRIRVPAGYEKKTGLEFEAEQRTFGYAFRQNYLPLIRVVLITLAAGGLFGFLGYNLVYKPLAAWTNYRAGYAQIANDRFTLANERFARATSFWRVKQWYYRYAEAFAARRNYPLAEGKYDELLKAWPLDKKGILDYARLESETLADYQKADGLLKQYLDVHPKDYEVLLASGDNNLAWGDRVREKYEAARLAYATLLQSGVRDELLFRMLRYFIRTDNGQEVERLRAYYFLRPEVKVDAPAFAELGGYLVDHRRMDFVQEVLFRADRNQPGLFDVHYNLARYYRLVQNYADEKKALDATAEILRRTRATAPLTTHRLNVEIDTSTRLGEYYYRTQQYILSERALQEAIRLVETYQQQKIIDRSPLYGRPYADLGDLSYYIENNLPAAAVQYQQAADNLYASPLLTYKIGYVQYYQKNFKGALASFASAEDASAYPSIEQDFVPAAGYGPSAPAPAPAGQASAPGEASSAMPVAQSRPAGPGEPPPNLLYALGDTFYQRGDYFAAQASFLRLRDRMESRRASLGILHPEDRVDDRAFLDMLVKVNNNLGVTTARLADKTGDRRKRSEALVYLSAANEIAASLARAPETVRRSEDRALPSLNMQGILFPVRGFVLQIYGDLPKDFESVTW